MSAKTIFLVDDHAVLRDGIKAILSPLEGITVVGEAGDGKTAVEEIERIKPSLVILDISLPVMTGIDVARQLKKYHPEIKIIILSQHGNEEYVNRLLNYGVEGYLFKERASEYLVNAITEVLSGNIFLDPDITKMLVGSMVSGKKERHPAEEQSLFPSLTEREKEVVKLIAEGHTSKEIGDILRISEQTVKVHRSNIMNKLKAKNTVEILKFAIRDGLIHI